ncbi:hypothetical protein BU17DRAFT_70116 [Hysterangium stoloniferum]|nr:hypothetical protein BU17DRAFT_70116 [Hysterangium stoloniferum]
MSKEVKRIGIHGDISSGPVIEFGGGFTFESSRATGAILPLGDDADSVDALDIGYFVSAIQKHRQEWLKFPDKTHRCELTLWDFVFVTGYDRTSSWAAAAFSGSAFRFGINLDIQTGIAKATVLGYISNKTHLQATNSGTEYSYTNVSLGPGFMGRLKGRTKQPYDGYYHCNFLRKYNDDGHNGGGGGDDGRAGGGGGGHGSGGGGGHGSGGGNGHDSGGGGHDSGSGGNENRQFSQP